MTNIPGRKLHIRFASQDLFVGIFLIDLDMVQIILNLAVSKWVVQIWFLLKDRPKIRICKGLYRTDIHIKSHQPTYIFDIKLNFKQFPCEFFFVIVILKFFTKTRIKKTIRSTELDAHLCKNIVINYKGTLRILRIILLIKLII